jgi:sugar phosphate isomerase/epimerase
MLRAVGLGLSASLATAPARLFGMPAAGGKRLGVCVYALGIRSRAERARGNKDFADPIALLEHCHTLGAGGIQTPLGVGDDDYPDRLRSAAERYGMFVEGIAGLPGSEAAAERFDVEVRTAKRAGANVIRVVMLPGRRYEEFKSADAYRQSVQRGLKSLELAEPVAARHGVRLALENHKGQRVPERLKVLNRFSSEHLGACVDVGNSFALLEDPLEAVRAYAPWAAAVHLKDQAVREYEEGFLFADAALGDGFLDLPAMVAILKEANPAVQFSLETITRDPLKVPCLAEPYWATFGDVPGSDLARTLRIVRAKSVEQLVEVSRLSPEEQVELESRNVSRSLAYAREHLGL